MNINNRSQNDFQLNEGQRSHDTSTFNLINNKETDKIVIKSKRIEEEGNQSEVIGSSKKIEERYTTKNIPQFSSNQLLNAQKMSKSQFRPKEAHLMVQNSNLKRLQFGYELPEIKRKDTFDIDEFRRQQTYKKAKTMRYPDNNQQMSQYTIKNKLPAAILQFIVKNAKLKNLQAPLIESKKSKTGELLSKWGLSKKLGQKYLKKKCQICQIQLPQKQFQKVTKKCNHSFCSSCLHQYVIFKIQSFQPVLCPHQRCCQSLDMDSKLYKELPLDVRKKYRKILQYQMVKKHPNRKMCPQELCQGYIQLNQDIEPICNLCRKKYCPRCLLEFHQGECDNKQLSFFQDTLHYRQCYKCKNVIEKSSGCIHMTCKCGYQFCYLCGAQWKHAHTCNNPDAQEIRIQRNQDFCCDCERCCDNCCDNCDDCCTDCCDCLCENCLSRACRNCMECCCDCRCFNGCDDLCCGCCECFGTCLIKILIFSVWIFLVFPFFILLSSILSFFWIFVCFLAGSTMLTIEVICNQKGLFILLSIFFLPITMIAGIGLAFSQIFCQAYWLPICQSFRDACNDFAHAMSQN